jgi:hypothetical protein
MAFRASKVSIVTAAFHATCRSLPSFDRPCMRTAGRGLPTLLWWHVRSLTCHPGVAFRHTNRAAMEKDYRLWQCHGAARRGAEETLDLLREATIVLGGPCVSLPASRAHKLVCSQMSVAMEPGSVGRCCTRYLAITTLGPALSSALTS